jgi:hypothetical protein
MHIHLPKVVDSWRDIAKEIAIIVVGVLIALFFEQLVERWQWHRKIAAAEAAIDGELYYDDGPAIYERAAMHPCVQASLNQIRATVEEGKSRTVIARAIDAYWTEFVTYDMLALDAANASDVATHMDRRQFGRISRAYGMIPLIERAKEAESADVGRLHAFRRTGGPVSNEEKDELLQAVEALRGDDLQIAAAAVWTLPALRELGGTLDPARTRRFMARARKHYGACVRDVAATA